MPLTLSCAEPDLYHFFFREEVEKGQRANPHLLQKDFPNPKESSTMTSASSKEEPLESSLKEGRNSPTAELGDWVYEGSMGEEEARSLLRHFLATIADHRLSELEDGDILIS
ncbi:hypothetical protein FH972_025301 [Carpinus fangiana]|uniref:Uncharacterized protein n=1 Tax=Carpinus fangiana TaxID=176857 RepID=A0A5N6L1M0_9ROSI|nr:hypothetical protein FH972_025301 [Carpinus fangiana]